MSIVTKQDFQRVHMNGKVLVNVPAGTQLLIKQIQNYPAWIVTADQPVTVTGENKFHVSADEYKKLIGV